MKKNILISLSLIIVFLFISELVAEAKGGGKGGSVSVKGYFRKDGTYVSPHYRSAPDGNPYNNWSYPGNVNPHTGKVAPGNPETYLNNYYNRKGGNIDTPNTSPSLPISPTPHSGTLNSKDTFQNYKALPDLNNLKNGTELERLFGTKQQLPVKQRSGGLRDAF